MKILRGSYPLLYPIPICLLGADVDGVPNYATVGNIGMVSFRPNLIMCSSMRHHHTNKGINENKTFSVNYPSADMVDITDYCGMISGKNVDKIRLFTNYYGELKNAPMIQECPANLECKVVDTLYYGQYDEWIGQVVETYIDEEITPDYPKKWPTIQQVNPLAYNTASNYHALDQVIGKGYTAGKKLINKSYK